MGMLACVGMSATLLISFTIMPPLMSLVYRYNLKKKKAVEAAASPALLEKGATAPALLEKEVKGELVCAKTK